MPLQECCTAIAKMFVDRRNLAASLKDARTIVGKLESVSVRTRGVRECGSEWSWMGSNAVSWEPCMGDGE